MSLQKEKRDSRYWSKQAASLPDYLTPEQQDQDLKQLQHRASILWSPQLLESDEKDVREYLDLAASRYNIEEEQALFLLRRHGFDLPLARRRLQRFETARGCRYHRWKAQDLVRLSKAFDRFGADFAKVREQLPHFPLAELRLYFYFMYAKVKDSGGQQIIH
ncbi:REST corepressor [Drosophila takahashii]|uniref:REST corepressor n=1 Tax=Drosophila takahashii TaxID=29030 RepID=UPI001CF84795|nr:REST corepressor [Drosophila takahashii]